MEIMPIIALLSIVSGSWLYWHDSAGTGSGFMRSAMGMAYGTGGALAIIAFIIGATMTRPAMTKATALSLEANRADPAKKEVMLAEAQSHRMRAGRAGKWVAILLGLAATAMAVGRYV